MAEFKFWVSPQRQNGRRKHWLDQFWYCLSHCLHPVTRTASAAPLESNDLFNSHRIKQIIAQLCSFQCFSTLPWLPSFVYVIPVSDCLITPILCVLTSWLQVVLDCETFWIGPQYSASFCYFILLPSPALCCKSWQYVYMVIFVVLTFSVGSKVQGKVFWL